MSKWIKVWSKEVVEWKSIDVALGSESNRINKKHNIVRKNEIAKCTSRRNEIDNYMKTNSVLL